MKLWTLSDTQLASEVYKRIKASKTSTSRWREEAKEDFNFAAGNQWSIEDIEKLEDEKRPIITFNRCNVIISSILGMEANQRQEVRFNPRKNLKIALSEGLTRIGEWAREYAEIPQAEAEVFEDMLTCGMGWSESSMDHARDLDGMIIQESVPPLEMYWDSRARKRNLSDAEWVAREQRMRLDEIIDKFDKSPDDGGDSLPTEPTSIVVEHRINPYGDESKDYLDEEEKGIPIYHFQWYENVPVWRIKHPQTGQTIQISEDEYNKNKNFIIQTGIPAIKQQQRKYYRVYCSSKQVYKKQESASQTGFTFKCVTGKKDAINKSWFGIIRLIKDPQRWANKFFSTFLDIIDSNAKGGILMEAGAADVKEVEEKWAKADSLIVVNQGAISNNRLMPKPVAQYPQAIDRLLTFSIQSIHDASGVNLELLGAVDRAEIGMVVDSRKRSAYTILAPFFDSLKAFRQSNALTLMEFIKNYIPIEILREVLPVELQGAVEEIKTIDLQRLNVIITESPQSDNNRYNAWMFMSQILPQIMQAQPGIPIPPSILDYSPLPAGLIMEWKQQLAEAKKPTPEKEMEKKFVMMMKQMELELQKVQIMLAQAQAQKIQMDTQKVQASIPTQQAETNKKQADAQKSVAETVQLEQESIAGTNIFGIGTGH